MTNKYCDSPIHKCLCLSLALIFCFTIVLSVPAAADDVVPSPSPSPIRPNPPIGWKDGDSFRDIMLVVLDSWGISFSKSQDDDSSLLSLFDDLFEEFLDTTNQMAYEFWDDVKFGASQTGDIILDFLGVNQIRQFANWLKDEFSLTDNSSIPVSDPLPISSSYHLLPYVGLANGSYFYITVDNQPNWIGPDVYFTLYQLSGVNGVGFCFFTYDVVVQYQIVYQYGTYPNLDHTWSPYYSAYDSGFGYYYGYSGTNFYLSPSQVPSDCYVFPTLESAVVNFHNFNPSPPSDSNSLVINTTIINIPFEDMDPEDGLQIEIPGTNWGDSIYTILDIIERLIGLYDSTQLNVNTVIELISTLLQGLQNSVSVENIPGAVVLDYDEYDIPLETEWSLVDGFFSEETEGSPFSMLTTILYGFPEPFVLFFSVIVVFVVAYGFIRLGRDSH